MATLTELADQAAADNKPQIVVIIGALATDRTQLATAWAWTNLARFAGGHLYADLQRYREREGVVVLIDVMGRFLRALGVRDEHQPPGLAARREAFQDLTADQPVFVLLDNADQAAQVRLFLPSAGGSMVLVTSDNRLSGLVMDGAATVHLGPPRPPDRG